MTQSMTAFASRTGALNAASWVWDIRGVNARGLDLRLRLPDGFDGLEAALRKALGEAFVRGNISVSLRLSRDDEQAGFSIDNNQLSDVLAALEAVQTRAFEMGVTLAQPTAADVLGQRGVMVAGRAKDDQAVIGAALIADIAPLVADFAAMRAAEGAHLHAVIAAQIDEIADLVGAAATAAQARRDDVAANMKAAFQRVMQDLGTVDPDRLAQELALIAVKSDITEEIDRLTAHVVAARALLADQGASGRKLDFLTQEFNREANTLCAKAGSAPLTAIGLALKAVIDQMREQIQNVE